MFFLQHLLHAILTYLRPFIKWFLHKTTRLTEIQRICYGAPGGAKRTSQVEKCLAYSKNDAIQKLVKKIHSVRSLNDEELYMYVNQSVQIVAQAKRINLKYNPDFPNIFGECVLFIWSYQQLNHIVEQLRSEHYNADNLEHEQKLLQLWNHLMPDEPLAGRSTKQWQEIGFQGDDPKTDFRGMGLLGLENLLYFAREYTNAAQHVLLHSRHPTHGYTFALVGINLTALVYRLLKSGEAKYHFYNVAYHTKQPCCMEQFHKLYCYLLLEFDAFWIESRPKNIMDYPDIYQRFEIIILEALHDHNIVFKTNLLHAQV